MTLAEQIVINIYYQDTDGIHSYEVNFPQLSSLFKAINGREFDWYCYDTVPMRFRFILLFSWWIHSFKLIALGKKSYLDEFEDEQGNTGRNLNERRAKAINIQHVYMHEYIC